MDWSPLTFDWNRTRAFLVTAEEGSFSAAARALGSTQPTLGRQVAALEEDLDVSLFERVGRGLELTPTGLALVEHGRDMAEAAMRFSRVAAGHSLSLDGSVRITAGEVLAVHELPAAIIALRARHPGIAIEVVATNEVRDLSRREADIALRNFRPTEPELVARKVRDDHGYLYATPGYLACLEDAETLEGLSAAEFIAFDTTDVFPRGLAARGLQLTPRSFPYVAANQAVQWALVTRGAGIGVMMASVGDADSRVVRVLPEALRFDVPIWLTSHRDVRTSRRVRVVFDALCEALSA
ncbi:MAG: LysR family transcriptional regulator [Myxococcota bacterium]